MIFFYSNVVHIITYFYFSVYFFNFSYFHSNSILSLIFFLKYNTSSPSSYLYHNYFHPSYCNDIHLVIICMKLTIIRISSIRISLICIIDSLWIQIRIFIELFQSMPVKVKFFIPYLQTTICFFR